jgi:RNA polymerase sigma-70 factor (ECF subfamily)
LLLVAQKEFEQLVEQYYAPLYRFGLSLSRKESDAVDLTQQTFLTWAVKGHQLRDAANVKTWLFTTLYRQFLADKRRAAHFVETDEETEFVGEPPHFSPSMANAIDAAIVQNALHALDDRLRAPVTLFYMQQHSYREIAEILDIPIGTVMSRISRGKAEMRKSLGEQLAAEQRKIIPLADGGQNG